MHNFPQLLLDCLDHKRDEEGGSKEDKGKKKDKDKKERSRGKEARILKQRGKEIQGTEDISD